MVPYVPVLLTSSQGEPAEVREAPPWEKDMRKGPGPRPQQGFNQSLKLNSVFAKRGSSGAQENLPWFWFAGGRVRQTPLGFLCSAKEGTKLQ